MVVVAVVVIVVVVGTGFLRVAFVIVVGVL